VLRKGANNSTQVQATLKQQEYIATGRVVDTSGNVLSGVSVRESGTTNATLTNSTGEFALKVQGEGSTLDFSYIGFLNVEQVAVGQDMQVVLMDDNTELEEIVVVGYGEQKKLSVVSSVSSVKGDALKFPTRNLSNNLAGQVAGLIAVQRSGEPGYDNSEF